MGSIGHFLADDAVHLVKFFHEVRLVMETACRIDKKGHLYGGPWLLLPHHRRRQPGLPPMSPWLMTGTCAFSPQILSCSTAPARNVSAAARMTL